MSETEKVVKLTDEEETRVVAGIVLEQGIPIPERTTGNRRWPDVFEAMKVGESFEVARTNLTAVAFYNKKYPDRHWEYRTDKTNKRLRVWRTR